MLNNSMDSVKSADTPHKEQLEIPSRNMQGVLVTKKENQNGLKPISRAFAGVCVYDSGKAHS
jgi:hypothetical protein